MTPVWAFAFPIDQSLDVHYPWVRKPTQAKGSVWGILICEQLKNEYLGQKEAESGRHATAFIIPSKLTCIKELGSHSCIHIKNLL